MSLKRWQILLSHGRILMYVCRNQAVASFHVAKKRLKKILFWKMVQNFFKKSIQFFFISKFYLVHGIAKHGQVLAIMGASGAGIDINFDYFLMLDHV
jgi:hypothetical protein